MENESWRERDNMLPITVSSLIKVDVGSLTPTFVWIVNKEIKKIYRLVSKSRSDCIFCKTTLTSLIVCTCWWPVQESRPLEWPIDKGLLLAAALSVCTLRCQRTFAPPSSFLKGSQNPTGFPFAAAAPGEWAAVCWWCWHWIYGLTRVQCCCRPMIALTHSQSWCWVVWEYVERCLSLCAIQRCVGWNVESERKRSVSEEGRKRQVYLYEMCRLKYQRIIISKRKRERKRSFTHWFLLECLQSRDMMKSVFCRVEELWFFFRFTDNGVVCISIPLVSCLSPPILLWMHFYLLPLFIRSTLSWVSMRHTETCSSASNIADAVHHGLTAMSIESLFSGCLFVWWVALDFRWRNTMPSDDEP